jgi:hypothetical protein
VLVKVLQHVGGCDAKHRWSAAVDDCLGVALKAPAAPARPRPTDADSADGEGAEQ